MKKIFLALLLVLLSFEASFAFIPPPWRWGIGIAIGGQMPISAFGSLPQIPKPVPSDASIELTGVEQGRVIITGFQCEYRGDPNLHASNPDEIHLMPNKIPFVIVLNSAKGSLSQTTDGRRLGPGRYYAIIVSSKGMNEVMFGVD